jgi:ABC-type glutathione transport system ATPase component
VANNGLPATFAIHHALKQELNVENRIGATFGKVYCGVVGGVRRHEFAVMGAPVNLAARLMNSRENKGILVDEAVRAQADARFAFHSLPPVKAKGYDRPVPILEPLHAVSNIRKKRSTFPFVGRTYEKEAILAISQDILNETANNQSSMIFLMGESGMGKSALAREVLDQMRTQSSDMKKTMVTSRSTSTETEQKIPLRYVILDSYLMRQPDSYLPIFAAPSVRYS